MQGEEERFTSLDPPEVPPSPQRPWAVPLFLAGLALWAWYLWDSMLLLHDTNVGTVLSIGTVLVVGVPVFCLALACGRAWPILLYGAALVAVVVLCAAPWHPRKRFLNDFMGLVYSREELPSEAQSLARMSGYARVPCAPETQASDGERAVCFAWSPDDPRFREEVGVVWLREGKVSRLEFLGP